MADVPSPEGSPSRLRRDPSFSLGGNIDAFYKGASAAIAAAFVLTLVVLTIAVTYWPSRLPKLSSAGGGWGSATAELMKPDMARE